MGRSRAITDDDIKSIINEWCTLNPNKKPTYSCIGEFARARGYNVKDYIFRRNELARDMIDSISKMADEESFCTVSVYHALDPDDFLAKNRTLDRLKTALTQRDQYYAKVARSAAKVFEENSKTLAENKRLLEMNAELKKELQKKQETADSLQLREKNKEIAILKRIIKNYVYPEIANALLASEGLLEFNKEVINDEALYKSIVSSEANIPSFASKVLEDMFNDIEKEN